LFFFTKGVKFPSTGGMLEERGGSFCHWSKCSGDAARNGRCFMETR